MLGLSLQKIAVFVGIIATLWAVFRLVRQVGKVRERAEAGRRPSRIAVEDMKECPVCGTYVAPAAALDCGRDRCPYPRTVG